MDPIEQRVRESLRARAEDAEPTPQLYREVQDRIARRRRNRLLAWVPAGAAALGVAVAVPMLLTSGPEVPNIEDYADERPASSPTTPHRVVTLDESFQLGLVDLREGSTTTPYGSVDLSGALPWLDVAASDRATVPAAVVGAPQDAPGGTLLRIDRHARNGTSSTAYGDVGEDTVGAQFEAGFAVDPDGTWLATLSGPPEDADGWALELRPAAGEDLQSGEQRIQPGIVVPAGSVIQEWTGATAEGGESQVTVVTPDGLLLGFPLVHSTEPEPAFTWVDEEITQPVGEREVAAYASSHLGDADLGFVLGTVGDGTVVQAVAGEEVLGQVDVSDLAGVQDPATFALDAWGDTAALSTPEGSWLLTHDGEGSFSEPVALPDGTVRAALVGKDTGEAPTEEPEQPTDEGVDDGDVVEEEQPGGDGELGDGLVVADDTTVTLVRPDGSRQELVTFPGEGESTVVDVAVRPGSTSQDLTLAVTTRAEGTFDVRWLRVRDGEVDTTIDPVGTDFPAPPIERNGQVVFSSPDLRDGGEPAAVWSPDGDLLAVVLRPGDGEPNEVRTIGWEDDGPNDDPNRAAAFALDTDRPLTPRQWVWTGGEGADRQGQVLLVDELAREAFTVRLDRQGDGAPAMPAENPLQPLEGEGVLDLAVDGDGTVDVVLRAGDQAPLLEWRTSDDSVEEVEVDAAGPRGIEFLEVTPDVLLVVLDARPMLVDRETGEVTPAPIEGEVVSADLIG